MKEVKVKASNYSIESPHSTLSLHLFIKQRECFRNHDFALVV